jgi:hypothetical protein
MNYSSLTGYAQMGYDMHTWSCNCLRYRWEFTKDGSLANLHRSLWSTPTAGSTHKFLASWYVSSDQKIHLKLDDTVEHCNDEVPPVCAVTGWNPQNQWTDTNGTWASEVDYADKEPRSLAVFRITVGDVVADRVVVLSQLLPSDRSPRINGLVIRWIRWGFTAPLGLVQIPPPTRSTCGFPRPPRTLPRRVPADCKPTIAQAAATKL